MADEWFNEDGYLRIRPDEDIAENAFLFTLTLWLIEKQIIDKPFDRSQVLHKYLDEIVNPLGRYDNHPVVREVNGYDGATTNWARTSHDQLTSYAVASYLLGREDHVKIWKQIKSTWFTYDNNTTKTNFKRLVHPRDIIFHGILANSYICKVLLPIYFLFGMFTYLRPNVVRYRSNKRNGVEWFDYLYLKYIKKEFPDEVFYKHVSNKKSGEILYWVKSHAMEDSLLKRLFYKFADKRIEKRFGGWSGLFAEYYYNEEHPINALASTHTIVV